MKVLVVDTLFENLALGLVEDDRPRALYYSECRRRNAQIAQIQLEELLQNLRWELKDLQGLIVNRGPGSYTGVRISLSLVRTLALVLRLPIQSVTSLEVLAFQVRPQAERFPVLLNCTRREVFWAWFAHDEQGVPRSVTPIQLNTMEELPPEVQHTPGRLLQLGLKKDPKLLSLPQCELQFPLPDAWALYRAAKSLQVPALPLDQVQPLYLKRDV